MSVNRSTDPGRVAAFRLLVLTVLWAAFGLVWFEAPPVAADGTETLGPPTIGVADGTGVVIGGTGLFIQPSSFDVVVPADASVEQVILYWESGHREGDFSGEVSDETLTVNGIEVLGLHAGGPTVFFNDGSRDVVTATHRVDITGLGLVGPGTTTLTIAGLDPDEIGDGAAVVIIYRQPGVINEIRIVDGNDIAFAGFPPPRFTTVPQTFTFAAEDQPRTAELGLVAASTHTTDEMESPPRPSALLYTVGGVTTRINDPFPDTQGRELDSVIVPVIVPAGETEITVQLISDDNGTQDLPASLVWMVGSLVVPVTQAPPVGSLVVRKEVTGVVTALEFAVDLDCSDDVFDQSLTLVAGGEVTVGDLPVGTECTVSEVPLFGFVDPVFSPSDTVTISAAGEVVEITVTNVRIPGELPPTGLTGGIAFLALVVLAVGSLLVVVSRRRPAAVGSGRFS
jgi:hypothetical protein